MPEPQIKQKSLKKNSIINLVKTVLGIIFPFITFPYASRILGTVGIGKVNYALSIIYWFELIAGLGISIYLTREGAKVRDDKEKLNQLCTEVFLLNIISTVIAYALMLVVIFLPVFAPYRSLLLLCGTTLIFNLIGIGWIFNIFEDYLYITVRTLAFQVLSLIALFLFVRTENDYLFYAGLTVFSSVGSNIYNMFYARRYVHLFSGSHYNLKRHIKPIFIIFGMSVASAIYLNMDMTMLGYMKGDHEEGLYSAAVKINKIVCRLITSACAVLIPRLAYYYQKGRIEEFRSLVRRAVNYILGLTIPAAVGMFLLRREIILLFSGAQFTDAIPAMAILCPNIILSVINGFLAYQIFMPMDKEKETLIATVAGAVVNLVFNIALIPRFGSEGAAAATVLAEGTVFLVCRLYMTGFYHDKALFGELWKYFTASAVMLVIGLLLHRIAMPVAVSLVVILVVCVASYVVLLKVFHCTILEEAIQVARKQLEKGRKP